jgi:hypothetical protein
MLTLFSVLGLTAALEPVLDQRDCKVRHSGKVLVSRDKAMVHVCVDMAAQLGQPAVIPNGKPRLDAATRAGSKSMPLRGLVRLTSS